MTEASSASPRISICICTHKRPEGLARLLASLRELQRPEGVALEVLVVDNDAAGSGRAVFNTATAGWPGMPVRYVVEPQPGVGHARSRCATEAQGDWIAFIDDDEWAEPQWLAKLWQQQQRSGVDGVFGPVLSRFEAEPPAWLVASHLFDRPRHPSGMTLTWADCASGNVLFRRRLYADVGGFDPAFAVSGAEDSDFFRRCIKLGARFVWCDEAVALEGIPPTRMTRRWLRRRAYIGGHNFVRLRVGETGWTSYVEMALRGAVAILLFGGLSALARLRGDGGSIRHEAKLMAGLGKVAAAFSPAVREYGTAPPSPPTSSGN